MKRMIKVTDTKTNRETWINVEYIVGLVPIGVGFEETKIIISGITGGANVKESVGKILSMLGVTVRG